MFNVGTTIMQSLNIKEWKLLELQITQTRHPNHFGWKNLQVQRKIFFKCAHNRRYTCSMHEWSIIMQSWIIKIWKLWELQITQTRHHLSILNLKMPKFKTPKHETKYSWNVRKIRYAHLQSYHHEKFSYRGMKTVGVTDYTNYTPQAISKWKKNLSSTPVKNEKIFIKCTQNKRCTSSMCNQSLCKVWI